MGEQQIQARNQSGVSEDALKEFSMMFRHFDKDKTGRLDHNAFKSCLRALGYDLPMVKEGEEEPEFEAILDTVDPNRTESISLQDYMAYMITKETENVATSDEIVNAFQAITTQERGYITKKELYAHLAKEMADYCLHKMTPYVDPRTQERCLRHTTTWSSPEPCSSHSLPPHGCQNHPMINQNAPAA